MSEQTYLMAGLPYVGATGPRPVTQAIRDARQCVTSLDKEGFELARMPSRVADWSDTAAIEAIHSEEVVDWAKTFSGCDAVLYYPAIVRSPAAVAQSSDFGPVLAAHSDYTESYEGMIRDGDSAYRQLLKRSIERAGISSQQIAEARRILTLQLWRNVGPARMEHPLALCDGRSVSRAHLQPVHVETYGGLRTEFDSFVLIDGPWVTDHRWFMFPDLAPDEVIVFRAYDSDRAARGEAFWTPHTAFKDPRVEGVPRSSVEMRAICLYW